MQISFATKEAKDNWSASRLISVLFIGSLFTPSRQGIIYIDNSTAVLVTIVSDLLLMICFSSLMGINRRIPILYWLMKGERCWKSGITLFVSIMDTILIIWYHSE